MSREDYAGADNIERTKPPQHEDVYLRTVYACGVNRTHFIRVHRSKWPPRSHQGLNPAMVLERPHVTGQCERCGANLIAYDPPDASLTVQLYGKAEEAEGRVLDPKEEKGAVIETPDAPRAGVVKD